MSSFVEPRRDITRTVWRLYSPNDKVVECAVEPTASKAHELTIVLDSEPILNECFRDAASAIKRAMQVRDRLLESRGWKVAVDAAAVDNRRAQPDF